MNSTVATKLLVSTALTAVSLFAPSLAVAQQGSGATTIEEVVVTAQKRTERLLDVPVAVTSVQPETLMKQNLVQLRDYYSQIPGLSLIGGGTEQRANSVSLRGVATGGGTAATVAITIDDVPLTSASYLAQSPLPDIDPADLNRIEVLRGPQGTLYGASSLGGLINFVTVSPNPYHYSGRVEVGANSVQGGDSGYSVRGSVNVPIISDRVAVRLSGFDRQDPAYIDNINPLAKGSNINDNTTNGGRVALFVKPFDALTLNVSAMRQHTRYNGSPSLRVCTNCGAGPFRTDPNFNFVFGDFVSNLGPTTREANFTLYEARAILDLQKADLTSISAWGRYDSTSKVDQTIAFGFLLPFYGVGAGSTTPLINADNTKKFTQEVRLSSKPNQPFEWLVGAFYTHEDILVRQVISVQSPTGAHVADPLSQLLPSTFEEKAVFADLTYHFTDKFDVQVGGRYSENKQTSNGSVTIDPTAQPIFGPNSVNTPAPSSDSSTTWLFTPRYRFSSDLMAYVRIATGYRPGGPNAILPNIPATFGPDTVTSYELGLKGELPAQHLTFDAALFNVDWDHVQLQATNLSNGIGYFTNGSTARSRGLELTGQWRPAAGLVIDANATFTDAALTGDIPQPAGASTLIGSKGDRLPASAKFVGNLSVRKDWQVSHGFSVYVGGGYSYVGDRYAEFNNILPPADPTVTNSAFGYRLLLPSYSLVNLDTGVYNADWTFNVYLRNLFDDKGVIGGTTGGGTHLPTAVFVQPRTYGVSLSRSF